MKLFLFKIFVFSIITFIFYNIYYHSRTKAVKVIDNRKVYIWGDSQTVQGFDLEVLREQTNLEFYSMAVAGGGIYDFACFTNLVPEKSKIIIGVSSTMFLRSENLDYNRTSMDWDAFFNAGISGYSISTLKNIILKNYKPLVVFPKKSENYLHGSNLNRLQQKKVEENYLIGVDFAKIRLSYFIKYLNKLKAKGCSVLLVQIPKSELLGEVEKLPEISNSLNLISLRIKEVIDDQNQLKLELSQGDFYDVTHLNRQGAKKFSAYLTPYIKLEGPIIKGEITLLEY
jgi:hypothetical protein